MNNFALLPDIMRLFHEQFHDSTEYQFSIQFWSDFSGEITFHDLDYSPSEYVILYFGNYETVLEFLEDEWEEGEFQEFIDEIRQSMKMVQEHEG